MSESDVVWHRTSLPGYKYSHRFILSHGHGLRVLYCLYNLYQENRRTGTGDAVWRRIFSLQEGDPIYHPKVFSQEVLS